MTVETLGSAIRLYRRTAATRSAILLIAANLIPLLGVLFFGWSLLTILVLYWLENGIVGFWNFFKINLAQGVIVLPGPRDIPDDAALAAANDPNDAAAQRAAWEQAYRQRVAGAAAAVSGPGAIARVGRLGLSIFFVIHYGIFWAVHGIFVFALPAFGNGFGLDGQESAFGTVEWGPVLIGAVALFLSHGASFLFNYVGRGEYLTASPSTQMGAVYGRVVVLHLTIIFGAFVIAFLGSPIGALLVLVVLKTAFDVGLHLRERRAADRRIPPNSADARVMSNPPADAPVSTPPGS